MVGNAPFRGAGSIWVAGVIVVVNGAVPTVGQLSASPVCAGGGRWRTRTTKASSSSTTEPSKDVCDVEGTERRLSDVRRLFNCSFRISQMVFASFATSNVGEDGRVTRITDELGVVAVDGDFETDV